jgi:ubiquinone/menaquinone biosynthesis C-methylase UbiE
VSWLGEKVFDTRGYEQAEANVGATVFEKAISYEWDYRYDFLTTRSWAERFREPFLDFGCGVGMASAVFERLGKQVVGCDISRGMLHLAKKRCRTVPLVLADGLHLPFGDKVFRTACVTGVLHHILELDGAVAELTRCTREVVCINEPCPKHSSVWRLVSFGVYCVQVVRAKMRGLTRGNPAGKGTYHSRYERPIDPWKLVELSKKYGFELVQVRYFNHIPLLHEFLGEEFRARLFSRLTSSKNGTDAEIIVASKDLVEGRV